MPRLSVWMVRAALLHLGLGFTLGALVLAHKGLPYASVIWSLLPLHIECVLIGWTLQLALGVAFWILPRFLHGPPRGDERPVLLTFGLLNVGVLLVGLSQAGGLHATWPLVGRALEGLAAALFAWHAWPRVKAYGV